MLNLHVLSSGSGGNSSVVCNAATHDAVVIDCGICKRDFFDRCDASGVDIHDIKAILITHDHSDHVGHLGVVLRGLSRAGVNPRIYVEESVKMASSSIRKLLEDFDFIDMQVPGKLTFGSIDVMPFRTSHDSTSSCGFRFESDGDSIGFMTDTGIVTSQAHESLVDCRILAIESNHDEKMLKYGDYPRYLKERIASNVGHLSNVQSANEVESLLWDGLETVIAMHISKHNNTFDLAKGIISDMLREHGHDAQVLCGYESKITSV